MLRRANRFCYFFFYFISLRFFLCACIVLHLISEIFWHEHRTCNQLAEINTKIKKKLNEICNSTAHAMCSAQFLDVVPLLFPSKTLLCRKYGIWNSKKERARATAKCRFYIKTKKNKIVDRRCVNETFHRKMFLMHSTQHSITYDAHWLSYIADHRHPETQSNNAFTFSHFDDFVFAKKHNFRDFQNLICHFYAISVAFHFHTRINEEEVRRGRRMKYEALIGFQSSVKSHSAVFPHALSRFLYWQT